MTKVIMICLLLGSTSSLYAQKKPLPSAANIKEQAELLTNGGFSTDTSHGYITYDDVDQYVKNIGKDAIPFLIDVIDRDQKGPVGFMDPLSSNVSLTFLNYTGIRAAYAIEYLLSDSSQGRISDKGVIVRTENGEVIRRTLSLADVKAIKRLYLSWWKANQQKSIKELQSDWKANKRALSHATYRWN